MQKKFKGQGIQNEMFLVLCSISNSHLIQLTQIKVWQCSIVFVAALSSF